MTSLKTHLLRMTTSAAEYEEAKMYEALQGTNKTVQAYQRQRCKTLAEAALRLLDWQQTTVD